MCSSNVIKGQSLKQHLDTCLPFAARKEREDGEDEVSRRRPPSAKTCSRASKIAVTLPATGAGTRPQRHTHVLERKAHRRDRCERTVLRAWTESTARRGFPASTGSLWETAGGELEVVLVNTPLETIPIRMRPGERCQN